MGIFVSFSWVVSSFLSGFSVGFFGSIRSYSYLMSPNVLAAKYVTNADHLYCGPVKVISLRYAYPTLQLALLGFLIIMFQQVRILHRPSDMSWLLVHLI